jgi:aldehyde:ferredoxin oxidoreductase
LCLFQNPGPKRLRAALATATGWDLELADLMQLGKRIVTLKRLLNMRRGLTRDADHLPALLQQPLPNGGTEGTVPDLNTLLSGAYAEYGWDPRTGVPTPETLAGLGLSELATSGRLTPSAMRRDSQGR